MLVGCHGRSQCVTWLVSFPRCSHMANIITYMNGSNFKVNHVDRWIFKRPMRRIWVWGSISGCFFCWDPTMKYLKKWPTNMLCDVVCTFEEFIWLGISSAPFWKLVIRGWFFKMNHFHLKKTNRLKRTTQIFRAGPAWHEWCRGFSWWALHGPIEVSGCFESNNSNFQSKKILKVTWVGMGPSCYNPFSCCHVYEFDAKMLVFLNKII